MTEPTYQTVPLEEYGQRFREAAEVVFGRVETQLEPARTRRDKGSYSVIGSSTKETVAKLVIYEAGKGKPMGAWPLVHDGVYVLVRVNGGAAQNIWKDTLPLSMPWHFRRLRQGDTIGVAPHYGERFAYLPLMAGEDIEEIVSLLCACADA